MSHTNSPSSANMTTTSNDIRKKFARIIGTGSYLPQRVVSNEALATELAQKGIETSDEWIFTRSGIKSRHYANSSETTTFMASQAAKKAIEMANLEKSNIQAIIVATSSPDMVFPSTACQVQKMLNINNHCLAFDVQAACSGFMYALHIAQNFIENGQYQHILVIGSECFSRLLNFNDRSTCVLFGDGAGAMVLSADDHTGIIATKLHANGELQAPLRIPSHFNQGEIVGQAYIEMDGKAVFKIATDVLEKVAQETLQAANWDGSELDFLVPHQANVRIIEHCAKKLNISTDKVILTLSKHGNTSAASIPLAFDEGVRSGKIQKNQKIMLEGVGAGFVWGASALIF
jgi:3-oxoacyl-[acyl-carrier-protein] synthase III